MSEIRWRTLADEMPEPECFVLTWNGRVVGVDWWGSLRYRRGDDTTHWCPFPKPPGSGQMYGLHALGTPASGVPAEMNAEPSVHPAGLIDGTSSVASSNTAAPSALQGSEKP